MTAKNPALWALSLGMIFTPWDVVAQDMPDTTYEDMAEAQAYVDQGVSDDLRSPPSLSLVDENPMSFERTAISFHYVSLVDEFGELRPAWLARRRFADFTAVTTRYASSLTCSGLTAAVRTAAQIERPRVSLPGNPSGGSNPEDLRDFIVDGRDYTLRARATFPTDDVAAELVMTGGSFSPLAAWATVTEAALAPCWTAESPLPSNR